MSIEIEVGDTVEFTRLGQGRDTTSVGIVTSTRTTPNGGKRCGVERLPDEPLTKHGSSWTRFHSASLKTEGVSIVKRNGHEFYTPKDFNEQEKMDLNEIYVKVCKMGMKLCKFCGKRDHELKQACANDSQMEFESYHSFAFDSLREYKPIHKLELFRMFPDTYASEIMKLSVGECLETSYRMIKRVK